MIQASNCSEIIKNNFVLAFDAVNVCKSLVIENNKVLGLVYDCDSIDLLEK